MPVGSLDTLIAHKAINLCDDLSGSEKRVAAVIVDHYNRKTGQCDPSLESISRLASLSRRTVIRAVGVLTKKGYIRSYRHGGKYHRNQYEPDWVHLRAVEARWTAKRKRKAVKAVAPALSPLSGQSCHTGGDTQVTQTLFKNSFEEETSVAERAKQCRPNAPIPDEGLSKRPRNETAYGTVRPRFLVRSTSSQNAVFDAAERRWNNSLTEHFKAYPDAFSQLIDIIDLDLQRKTTEMELRRQGSGFPFLLSELHRRAPLAGISIANVATADTAPHTGLTMRGNSGREIHSPSLDFRRSTPPKEEPNE
jgi:hypothetical protein